MANKHFKSIGKVKMGGGARLATPAEVGKTAKRIEAATKKWAKGTHSV